MNIPVHMRMSPYVFGRYILEKASFLDCSGCVAPAERPYLQTRTFLETICTFSVLVYRGGD